jgi:hypothetical protein
VRRPIAFAVAAALFLLAAAPAVASANSESSARRRLATAVEKTAAAKSLVVRATGELRESGQKPLPFYRLEERTEDAEQLKTDIRRFPPDRWAKQPTDELVTVGSSGWYRAKAHRYREVTFGPEIVKGFESEFAHLERAVATSKDLKTLGAGRYELTTPDATFNGPEGGAGPTHLLISLSAAGYVHRLRRLEEAGPQLVVLVETFTSFGHSFGIAPPPAATIEAAPVKEITTQEEFSHLLGPPPFGDD